MGFKIKGQKREVFGKNASRRIRQEGNVPAIFYGAGISNVPLILDKKDIFAILKSDSGENTIFQVSYDGEAYDAMIKEMQIDPVTDELIHVDLVQIAMDKTIEVAVQVEILGEAVGVKAEGGFVDVATREIEVECLPKDIPEQIQVDISALRLHQSIKVKDLPPIEGVTYLSDPQAVVVLIEAPSKEEEVVPEVAEEEMIPEEEEPEVIKRERPEEEEEEKE